MKELIWTLANDIVDIMSHEAFIAVKKIDSKVADAALMSIVRKEAYKLLAKTQCYPNGFASTSVSEFHEFEILIHGNWYKIARIAGKRSADTLVFTDPAILVTIA